MTNSGTLMNFNNPYSRDAYKAFFQNQFLTDEFKLSEEQLEFEFSPQYLKSAIVIGEDKSLELKVIEALHDSENDPRVGLSKDIFRLMSSYGYKRALVLLHSTKSENYRLSLATIELSLEGSKVKKEYSNPRRYSFFLGPDAKVKTPHNFLIAKGRVKDFDDLLSRFSVEVVTKQFYEEIANWYFWAMDKVEFPDDVEKDKEQRNAKNLIRLITRLIFIWFMKEKNLIPKTLFDKTFVDRILNYKDKTGSTYYKAILQNLFFATLNTQMKKDDPKSRIFVEDAVKLGYRSDAFLEQGYYRYSRFIKDKELFLKEFENIPFLNGGLFESLDKGKDLRVDCFSDNPQNEIRLKVPDELFFLNHEIQVDLSKYLEKGRNKRVTGLLEILNRYNFTIDENTPIDQDVALDPELLGKVFENLLASYNPETATTARKATGSYYTPREIVDYMVDESLIEYLTTKMIEGANTYVEIGKNQTNLFGNEGKIGQLDIIENLTPKRWLNKKDELRVELRKLLSYDNDEMVFNEEEIKILIDAIEKVKILDPACGSGAFPMGILHKLVLALHKLDPENKLWKEKVLNRVSAEMRSEIERSLENKSIDYIRKLGLIENCIYGVDIQEIAIQISKLRFFISLLVEQEIDDSKPNRDIRALPNLETKFVAANTLISLEKPSQFTLKSKEIDELETALFKVREEIFYTNSRKEKLKLQRNEKELREKLKVALKQNGFPNETAEKITSWDPFDQNTHSNWFDPEWMFGVSDGFDIVIGNPPYISTKAVDENFKKQLEKQFGFADDTYNHFYFKGIELLKNDCILTYISSKTFWTIQTKKNLRQLILKNKLLQLFDTANPFESAMVDTCVTLIQKVETNKNDNYEFIYLDGKNSLSEPNQAKANIEVYKFAPNQVFFPITDYNLEIYHRYGKKVNELLNMWWDRISTSKNIDKFKKELDEYRQNLKSGDLTLLGLITEGGQGLATANNGKYVGVLEGTKWADNVRKQRPEKLLLASDFCKKEGIKTKTDAQAFLNGLKEGEIRELFDSLKEKHGRDIFGQGWLYRIVNEDEIADVESLTEDEKLNGIKGEKTFVPYDKGDKDGNRWWAPTPYYIDWSKENVKILQTDPKARWQGYQFYFREGFCWTDVNSTYLKSRLKQNGVYDVLTMSLFTSLYSLPDFYFVCIINSKFISEYVDDFVNSTSHFQINDARQLPIIIPTTEQLQFFENIFNRAVAVQKEKFAGKISETEAEEKLKPIQEELDSYLEGMFIS